MIQLGKRTLCTLLAVGALSISGSAFAQNPPAPTPTPTDPAANDPNNPNPTNNPTAAQPTTPPAPAPSPTAEPPKPVPEAPKTTFPTMQGPMLRLGELFAIRPGMFLQFWGSMAQDQIPRPSGDSGQFAKNFYLRRARFYLLGTIAKNITWFLLWESANLGQSGGLNADMTVNKNYTQLAGLGTAFGFNDAWMDFKINNALSIQAGLFLIPFTRNILRDTGVQVKLNAADGKLEGRAMVSQGVKQPETLGGGRLNGKNDPRLTGFLQYNFFDPDAGYVFNGQYFGRKKIAAIAAGVDYQSLTDNPYFATSLTGFAAIPLNGVDPKNGGDEIGGQVEYLHFHGGGVVLNPNTMAPVGPPQPGLPVASGGLGKQDALLVEAGYYNKAAKFSVFGKFEGRFYKEDNQKFANQRIYGVGVKYFLAEQIANLTLMYSLTQTPDRPDNALRNDSNAIQLQLQVGYF